MAVLPFEGILKPEAMLRQAQAEVTELQQALERAATVLASLNRRLNVSTVTFCAAVVQAGGEVTISQDELIANYSIGKREDPATHAVTWKVERQAQEVQASPVQ